MAGRLARSHGGQGSNGLILSLLKRNLRIAEVSPFDTLSDYNQKADVSSEQTDFQVAGGIDQTTINQHFAIRQAHNQTTVNNAFKVNTVGHFFSLSAVPDQ